jgi:hypothetical protein
MVKFCNNSYERECSLMDSMGNCSFVVSFEALSRLEFELSPFRKVRLKNQDEKYRQTCKRQEL